VIRLTAISSSLIVQLITSGCTGYGLIYDDKRLETNEYEENCLSEPNTSCLLQSAHIITTEMSDEIAQSEALAVLAKNHFELGDSQAALNTVVTIPIIALQFNVLFELSAFATHQSKAADELLAFADKTISNIQASNDKLPALILGAILSFVAKKPKQAKLQLNQAISLAMELSGKKRKILGLRFFRKILPKLMQFDTSNAITKLISLHTEPSQRLNAQVEYLVQLKEINRVQAEKQIDGIMLQWSILNDQQQRNLAQASIVKLLVNFNKLKQAQKIKKQQTNLVSRITISAVITQQLAEHGKLDIAKKELLWLLQEIRQQPKPSVAKSKQQIAQDKFTLDTLRAQAIADLALALSKNNKMTEAVHFAEQIQPLMGHIQGYTLTQLAMSFADISDINAALLTMESIHRPVNRAACLAQISAHVAKYAANANDIQRAITIATRVNRQSWRDIANSEISIAQAELNDINAAMKTLKTIQRSYSAVYAMSRIARTLHLSQNKR